MIKINHLMMFTKIISVKCEVYKEKMNVVFKQNTEFLSKMRSLVMVTIVTKYINITEV